jgi:DNA-binding LacI/PurR family transcriptional regulator
MSNTEKIKPSTIIDVAKHAGVTIGTVSHVINGTAPITEKTKKKVRKAIYELNYKPNSMARSLRMNKSKMIGLLLPDIMNEYYAVIARSFTDSAYGEGYSVMLCSFQYDLNREKLELDVLLDKRVDAIVLFGGSNADEKLLSKIRKQGIPIILGDRSFENGIFPSLKFDNEAMVKKIVEVLKDKGYRKIGFVTETLTMTNLQDRYNGYLAGMSGQGLEINKQFIYTKKELQMDKLDNGFLFMKRLLEKNSKSELPEVFIATSDLIAIGMMGAIKEAGLNVPQDIGIVGYDNISIASYVSPKLTTVMQDGKTIGTAAWDMTYQVLKKKASYIPHLVFEQKLIVRESI